MSALNYILISKNKTLYEDAEIHNTLDKVTKYIESIDTVAFGVINSGMDPHTSHEYCLQIGDENIQYIIDLLTFTHEEVRHLLEYVDKTYIFHNA